MKGAPRGKQYLHICSESCVINRFDTYFTDPGKIIFTASKYVIIGDHCRRSGYLRKTVPMSQLSEYTCVTNCAKVADAKETVHKGHTYKLMVTPACPRLLDMINDFVLLRF